MIDGALTVLEVIAGSVAFLWFVDWYAERGVKKFYAAVQGLQAAYRDEADSIPQDMESQRAIAAKYREIARAKGEQIGRSMFW